MSVAERSYMGTPEQPVSDPSKNRAECAGIVAANEEEAAQLLRWACPTQGWDGKWYRVTIAVSNVPVRELYSVMSNLSFIADKLFRDADPVVKNDPLVKRQVECLRRIHELIRQRDEGLVGPICFDGQNIHAPKLDVPAFAPRPKKPADDLFAEAE